MADPVTWLAVGSSVVAGGMSIAQGYQQRETMRGQAAAAEYQAKISELQGKQVNGQRLDELNQALGAIDTMRAGRGVNLDSETGRAIRRDRRTRATTAINNEVLGYNSAAQSKRNEATGLRRAGKWAVISGFANSLSSFASAAGGLGGMGGGKTPNTGTVRSAGAKGGK